MLQKKYENMITWLHLSDFHVGKDNYRERKLFKEILKHVKEQISNSFIPDLIFITGDLANNGEKSQYEEFTAEFLKPLYESFDKDQHPHIFIVPGNHDVMREKNRHINRVSPCRGKSKFFLPTTDGLKERKQFIERFQAYIKNDSLIPKNWIKAKEGSYSTCVEINGKRIGVVGINTAWLSMNNHDKEKLSPGVDILQDALNKLDNCVVKIVLGHHPIEWFRSEQIQTIKTILDNHNALYIHGHLHKPRINPSGNEFLCVQCGAAFNAESTEMWENGFLWAKLDLACETLHLQPWQWNQDYQNWAIGPDFRTKNKNGDWWIYPLPRPERSREMSVDVLGDAEGIPPKHVEHAWFTGRKREIEEFKKFLHDDRLILYFYGASGVGKSWLLNQFLKELSQPGTDTNYQVAYIDCKEISSLIQFMDEIAHSIGGIRLPNFVSKRSNFSEDLAANPVSWKVDVLNDSLFDDLKVVSLTDQVVLFIDSFEKVQRASLGNKLLKALKYHFGESSTKRFKVVIGSQWGPDLDHLPGLQITPFSHEELTEFAEKNLGITESAVIDFLAIEWKSDPLVLGQLEGQYPKKRKSALADHLSQLHELFPKCIGIADSEILERMMNRIGSEDVRKVLSICSVPWWFDAPVLRAMIGCDVKTSHSNILELSKISYVEPRINGIGYKIHERCRSALLSRLIRDDEELFLELSKKCYKYLQVKDARPQDISREFELIYHLMAFDSQEALLQYNNLRYIFTRLKRIDLMEGLQGALEAALKINPQITPICQNWIQYGRAAIYHQMGQYDLALDLYNKLLKQPALDLFLQARTIYAKGDILAWHQQGNDKKVLAKKLYLKAAGHWATLLKKKTSSPGVNQDDARKSLGETYLALAKIEEVQGSLIKGMEYFRIVLRAYKECDKDPSYSETLRMMARNLRLKGNWKEAHLRFIEAEKVLKVLLKRMSLGDTHDDMRTEEIKEMIQDVRNARAALWKEEGKWREAKKVLREVIIFLKNIPDKDRNKEKLGIALIDFGDVLRLEGNFLKAKNAYAQAQENLNKSERNKGYPLLGFAEIAIAEGMKEKALEFLNKASKSFIDFKYTRKLLEVELCLAKLDRDSEIRKAIKRLNKAYKMKDSADYPYTRSAILVELTEMVYEADGDTKRYRDYHREAIMLASQEQGMFNDHLSRLHFLGGSIAGKKNPVHAIPEFVVALSCAVQHNKLTLNQILSQEVNWLSNLSTDGTEPSIRKVNKNNIEAKVLIRRYEKAAMLDLPETSRIAFKGAVEELKRSLV